MPPLAKPSPSARKRLSTQAPASAKTAASPRVNVYRVAERAGVSPGTVSRVLNNRGRVLEETSRRVLEAARALGFRPQVHARARQVAIVSDNIGRSFDNWGYYREIWSHTAFALNKHGLGMLVPDTLDELRQRHVDGIVVIGEYPPIHALLAELKQHAPVVLTDDFSSAADRHWVVRSDQRQAGRLAAEHFIQGKRKRLGFVGSWGAQEQAIMAGYREAMSHAKIRCHDELFVMRSPEINFYNAVSRVVQLGADAVFIPGANYEAMEGLNVIANVLRLRIPEDVALIGGEIHGVSAFVSPPMTTIESPLGAVAARAVVTLEALMRGEKPPRKQDLPVRLLARQSA